MAVPMTESVTITPSHDATGLWDLLPEKGFRSEHLELTSQESESSNDQDTLEPIAVVGFSLKFPGDATCSDSFWDMLVQRRSAMTQIPKDRANIDAFYHEDGARPGAINARGGHFVSEDLGAFDASFFSISPTEAASMDPQHRILLETAYRALENAGISLEAAKGSKTGVYTGSFADDYRLLMLRDSETIPKHAATGANMTMLAARLSWFFDLKGPAFNLDTACSSSMVALDVACQAIRSGECDQALVGGANIIYGTDGWQTLANMSFLSPDSRCYSFDSRGNGYSRGEGFGVVVIKPLSAAIANGDTIRGIIRSTGSNQDGRTPGITQPSGESQEMLIRATYQKANLDLKQTRFFEAHGTGTALGDPTESAAIASVFSSHRSNGAPLFVGAVKSNIGHLEGASGIAGLIKALLTVEKGIIPPNANFEKLNSRINAKTMRLSFPTQATLWPGTGLRRASVNSFGFGGTNSHMVLDDVYHYLEGRNIKANHCTSVVPSLDTHAPRAYSDLNEHLPVNKIQLVLPKVLLLSAHDQAGLHRQAQAYATHFKRLRNHTLIDERYMIDLAYTLNHRRSRFSYTAYAICSADAALQDIDINISEPIQSLKNPGICMVFTGQGSQYATMGKELLAYHVFSATLAAAETALADLGCQWSLMDELLKPEGESRVNLPEFSQPLCTALQIAQLDLLGSLNIYPAAVVGHSSGEIAAAYATGALSLASAIKVAYFRGLAARRLAQSGQRHGAMLAVGLGSQETARYMSSYEGLSIACHNSPKSVTVSGDAADIEALKAQLDRDDVFNRVLRTGLAYHSTHMLDIASYYLDCLGSLESGSSHKKSPRMVSSVHVKDTWPSELREASYWVANLTQPVMFEQALSTLLSDTNVPKRKLGSTALRKAKITNILEIGPHATLSGPVKDCLDALGRKDGITYMSLLNRKQSPVISSLQAVGQLCCLGYPVDLDGVNITTEAARSSLRVLTDLPEYQFDHSKTYWAESRISKNYRHRKVPRSEWLGIPVPDWNPHQPRWRHFIRLSEMPWVEDHKVNGQIVYPATGMLVMAVEAVKQLLSDTVEAFVIREAMLTKALMVPEHAEGIEVQLQLRKLPTSVNQGSSAYSFACYSYVDEDWHEHCQGTIVVEHERKVPGLDEGKEQQFWEESSRTSIYNAMTRCTTAVNKADLYKFIRSQIHIEYGPNFQLMTSIQCNDDLEAVAEIDMFSGPKLQHHVVHPATLDATAQTIFVALTRGGKNSVPTTVPTRIENLWLRNKNATSLDSDARLLVYVKSEFQGLRGTSSRIIAVNQDSQEVVLSVESLQTTHVGDNHATLEPASEPSSLCYGMSWRPDHTLMSNVEIQSYCQNEWKDEDPEISFYEDLALLQYSYLVAAQKSLTINNSDRAHHLNNFVDWIDFQIQRCNSGATPYLVSSWNDLINAPVFMTNLAKRLECTNKRGKFFVTIGRNLQGILTGQQDALEIFFADGLSDHYYAEMFSCTSCSSHVERYVDLLAHKTPSMKVLEIGGGTGGFTSHILGPLVAGSQARCEQYVFTDISPSFFERVRENWKTNPVKLDFQTLNIERSPDTQNFELGAFDLIAAGSVLHATADIRATLTNTRKLLKPGGKLVMFEIVEPEILRAGFAFGLLEGWWLSIEPEREHGPCMSADQWDQVLKDTGFSGVDIVLHDYRDASCRETAVLIATAVEVSVVQAATVEPITILINPNSDRQRAVANEISRRTNAECQCISLHDLAQSACVTTRTIVSLLELDNTIFPSIDPTDFVHVKTLFALATDLLWVTQDATNVPEANMINGLARSLRMERPDLTFITLAIDDCHASVNQVASHVQTCIQAGHDNDRTSLELEYCVKDNRLCVARLQQLTEMDETVRENLMQHIPEAKERRLGDCQPIKLVVGTPGLLDTLHFVEDDSLDAPLGANEVEIEISHADINFMDILTVMGSLSQATIGGACAGRVSRVGDSVEDLRTGDRVAACILGCMKTHARQRRELVTRIPNSMAAEDAVALLCTHVTAHHGLVEFGRLQAGETVLIHSGAGGTGQAAIQTAQLIGAEIYATVGSQAKKELLMSEYGIPGDHIFYSRDTSFARGVMRMTQGRGVDVVFNSLSDDKLVASWELMAPFGRFIEIGKKDIHGHSQLPMFPFAKNVSFHCLDLASMSVYRPKDFGRSIETVMRLATEKRITTARPLSVYSVSSVVDAFKFLQSGKNMGKTIIHFNKDDIVPTRVRSLPRHSFQTNATYVIAGGLGGLGRSMARWMCQRGAKNLILFSRRGPSEEAHHKFLKELRDIGVRVEAPACDIVCEQTLMATISSLAVDMPPIKGCIQSTMVLRDLIFDNMDHPSWLAATRPKVQGSWNLHQHLPADLDFFIQLSSVAGVLGSPAQSNYAAGNTYQDALAAYRIAQGQKAVAVDVGWMADEGYVSQNVRAQQNLKGAGVLRPLSQHDLLAVLEHYCFGENASSVATLPSSHVVLGLQLPATLRAKSIEEPQFMQTPLFSSLQVQRTNTSLAEIGGSEVQARNPTALLAAAKSLSEAKSIVLELFVRKTSRAIGMASDSTILDTSKPLFSFGVDSLVALELKNWAAKALGINTSVLELLSDTALSDLVGSLTSKSQFYTGPKE